MITLPSVTLVPHPDARPLIAQCSCRQLRHKSQVTCCSIFRNLILNFFLQISIMLNCTGFNCV